MKGGVRPYRRIFRGRLRKLAGSARRLLFVCALVLSLTLATAQKAEAGCCCTGCDAITVAMIEAANELLHVMTREWVTMQFESHKEDFVIGYFFAKHLMAAMQTMTTNFTNAGMVEVMAVGAFLDAKHQMETQLLFQQLKAQAHKDYQPATEMCAMGTIARGLGPTARNAEVTAVLMAKRSRDRQTFARDTVSAAGREVDQRGRVHQFIKQFCDIHDNNDGLEPLCENSAAVVSQGLDADYSRVYHPMTIDVDFTDNVVTNDEQGVLALGTYLFGHKIFKSVSPTNLKSKNNQGVLLDMRSIIAKRSVAEYSYYNLVGMKAAGSAASEEAAPYMNAALEQLGMGEDEAKALIGERPSYYAQMELLSKKIYEDPDFYTALYDTPANLVRKGAAIRAIDLMQDADTFKSQLRNEALLSVIIELELTELQDSVQNRLNKARGEGQTADKP